ncbi:MAG: hypothetical protein MJ066_06275, partial [Clostridia bacterium]|nr:hypothetical protein [Clostridia bacterium]
MINGYSKKRAKKYVLTDFTVISVFGLIFGNVFGQLFSRLTILNLSGYTDYFVKGISLKGSLFGTLISVSLIIIMTIFALKKIDGFDLRDANSVC